MAGKVMLNMSPGSVARKKSYDEILQEEISNGTAEIRRSTAGLFLSGCSAGLDVGFSLLMVAIVLGLLGNDFQPLLQRAFFANAYSVGFIFVNLGRSELFTEHTTLMMFPVLDREESIASLLRVWMLVYSGNLLGGALFAVIAVPFGLSFFIVVPQVLHEIASHLVSQPWWVILVSAIMAGWMMGILSWLVAATADTTSQIICVWLVTGSIGFAKLHHCIAGSVEVIAGFWGEPAVSFGDYLHFLGWATLGNVIGGVFFSIIKYSHAVRGRE